MKIVLVGTAYPLRGGIAHYFALLYKNLSLRHDVEVVTFTRQYPVLLFPGKSQEEQLSGGVAIPTERLIDSINPITWITAARAIARKKPDLLIFKYWLPFFGPCFGAIASMVRGWTGAKILFICDNVIPHERRPGDLLFTRFAFRYVDYFIAQSRAVEHELKQFWPAAKYRFAPHPVYEIFGKSIPKELARKKIKCSDKRIILFFGYIRRYKGLETLLRAMPLILKRLSVTLLVVGEFYDDEHRYRELLETLSIEKNVQIRADYVPNDQVGPYFSASDVVVLPYHSATQSGIVQIAYQFDKSVIATGVGGLSEVVIDGVTGFIVPPNDPSALADAVVEFYQKKLEEKFERGVKKEKPRYSWDSMVKTIEELVQGQSQKATKRRSHLSKS
jgi:glycosyltransferase involved in cell wall biosynthesis